VSAALGSEEALAIICPEQALQESLKIAVEEVLMKPCRSGE
jgi:hypothetical protein